MYSFCWSAIIDLIINVVFVICFQSNCERSVEFQRKEVFVNAAKLGGRQGRNRARRASFVKHPHSFASDLCDVQELQVFSYQFIRQNR